MQFRNSVAAIVLLFAAQAGADSDIERGRFLMRIGGCNDCHTAGYIEQQGQVPEAQWLAGSPVGYQGPWGTTYAANLRLKLAEMSQAEWLVAARQQRLPPMPWFNLATLDDADMLAVYRYIRSLGPAGEPAPAYVAPGGLVTTPYIVFVPQEPERSAANTGR